MICFKINGNRETNIKKKKLLLRRDAIFSYRQMSYLLPDDRVTVQEMHRHHVAISVHIFLHSWKVPRGPKPPQIQGFTITLRHTTIGKTPLDE